VAGWKFTAERGTGAADRRFTPGGHPSPARALCVESPLQRGQEWPGALPEALRAEAVRSSSDAQVMFFCV